MEFHYDHGPQKVMNMKSTPGAMNTDQTPLMTSEMQGMRLTEVDSQQEIQVKESIGPIEV